MRTPIAPLVLVFVSSILAACGGEGRTRGPSARVVAVNAASSYPQIVFLREERIQGGLDFAAADQFLYEVGQYDFNLEVVPAGQGGSVRLKSFSVTLQTETEYYFVITEVGGVLEPLIVTQAPFSPTAGNAEASIVHAAYASPTMDIYLTAPGADLSAANPIGTVAFNERVAPSTYAAGDYELSFTAAGNPLNVLFRSDPITFLPAQSNFFVIADAGDGTSEVRALRVTNGVTVLVNVNAPTSLRMVSAVTDTLPRDVFIDSDFSTPFFGAVPYAEPTAPAPIAPGDRTISVTPAGNSGVIEVEAINKIFTGYSYTGFVAGDPGALVLTAFFEDRRRVLGEAHLRYYDGATQFTAIQISIAAAGTSPGGLPVLLASGGSAEEFPLAPGDYEITVRAIGATTDALGPLPITVASEGIYSILFLNGPTADTASVVLFDDF